MASRAGPRCAFLPPHILEHVAEHSDDAGVRARCHHTLLLDEGFRAERRAARGAGAAAAAAPERAIYDAGNREQLPGRSVRTEGRPPSGDVAVDESYDWLGVTFDFLLSAYQRNSLDGRGLTLIATVHYGRDYANAFWNGAQLVYGDGDGQYLNRFTLPTDITAHEAAHGVVQYSARLGNEDQNGALHESIADVFGSLAKQYHLQQTSDQADWLIGQGLFTPAVQGAAIRSMKAPGTAYDDPVLGKDPQPSHMRDYVETDKDNGGVHINSGIPNYAFYLTATALGGHAWQRAGRVWYEALTGGGLSETADFPAASAVTAEVATRLYGETSTEAKAVRDAWSQVGLVT